jgi:hypothetical protein
MEWSLQVHYGTGHCSLAFAFVSTRCFASGTYGMVPPGALWDKPLLFGFLHSSQPTVSPPIPMEWSLQVHYGTSHCSFAFCIRLNPLFRLQSTVISQVDTLLLRYRRMDTESMHLSILVTTLSSQGLSNQVLAINMCLRKQTCCFSKYISNRTEETCERDADWWMNLMHIKNVNISWIQVKFPTEV